MKKALVTGIHGFVAPHMVHELEEKGYEVFVTGRKKDTRKNYFVMDVTDSNQVREVFEKIKPDFVFHLAAVGIPGAAQKDEENARAVTVTGAKNILLTALDSQVKPKVLLASSSTVYGAPEYLPIDEDHPLNGKNVYAKVRIEMEEMAKEYFEKLDIIIVRSFNHTGVGQTDSFVVSKIIKQICEIKLGKRDFLEMGNTEIKRDILDVRDVVKAYRMLLEEAKFGQIINVCRGVSISLKDIIESGRVLAQLEAVEVRVNPDFVRPNDVLDLYGDNSRLKETVNWQAEISYNDMIKEIYKSWFSQLSKKYNYS